LSAGCRSAPHVPGVELGQLVADDRLAVATHADLSPVAVAQQHAERDGARQRLHQLEVGALTAPGDELEHQVRMAGGRLVLEPVSVVEVPVLVGVERLHDALPRLQLLIEHSHHRGRRMELQVLADVRVAETRTPQERWSVERTTGCDHGV
jgi:hypothetical protein